MFPAGRANPSARLRLNNRHHKLPITAPVMMSESSLPGRLPEEQLTQFPSLPFLKLNVTISKPPERAFPYAFS